MFLAQISLEGVHIETLKSTLRSLMKILKNPVKPLKPMNQEDDYHMRIQYMGPHLI